MPMLMVTLRCVKEIEKPFALGFQLLLMRLLGKFEMIIKIGSLYFKLLISISVFAVSFSFWTFY